MEVTEGMRTLYVSDLDGTLLRSDEKTSDYTNRVIHNLTEKGVFFLMLRHVHSLQPKKQQKVLLRRFP